MIHPNCEHICTGNCRREGCECLCGEYHDTYEVSDEEKDELLQDSTNDLIP